MKILLEYKEEKYMPKGRIIAARCVILYSYITVFSNIN